MALKRVFLIGSNRAEFEHVYGPLKVDEVDPRFVLVDEETEEKIVKFPNGVPPQRGQDWPTVEKIREHEANAAGVDSFSATPSKTSAATPADVTPPPPPTPEPVPSKPPKP